MRLMARIIKGILLKPALNLLEWILKRDGNSIIIGGPLGWSWQATLDTAHHGSLSGPANAHRHSDLANIGIDDHHARDHATRHHAGGGDALALGSIAGNLTDAQHGSRSVANAHAHSHLSGIGANDHHNRQHDHSLAADGSPIAMAGLPDLAPGKIWKGDAAGRPAEADPPVPTKEAFSPVAYGTYAQELVGNFPARRVTAADKAYLVFQCPHDFSSIVSAELVCVTGYTGDQSLVVTSDYGAEGEDYNHHEETDTINASFTANKLKTVDISSVLSTLAAGDCVAVEVAI